MNKRIFMLAASIAALPLTPAHAEGWYGGVDAGTGALSESGAFGVATGGFAGPTVDHDLCGDTATITVGAEPFVTRIDSNSTAYRLFVGKRWDSWAVEAGRFNLARLGGSADSAAYGVAQPTCNPVPVTPITVEAFGRKLETVAFDGFTVTPVYAIPFADRWTLDLRATVAFWSREDRSQWQIVVTELQGGTPLQTYPTTWVNGSGSDSGVDLWLGVGTSWEMKDGVRLRGIVEQQDFGDLSALTWTLGLAIDFK